VKISYLVTVKDELQEIQKLITGLLSKKEDEDEIVVLQDSTPNSDDEGVKQLKVKAFLNSLHEIKIISGRLNEDFASFKNFGKQHCTGDYIFQIDADEIVSTYLLENIKTIIGMNEEIELYWLPRINIVKDLTDEWVKKWGWKLSNATEQTDEQEWNRYWWKYPLINWPDYQSRLFKNIKSINWIGAVHEVLAGSLISSHFPAEIEYALYHEKQLDKQIKQNEHYSRIVR
jgi:glycosyltransferase involved in cell wall biosynthesis